MAEQWRDRPGSTSGHELRTHGTRLRRAPPLRRPWVHFSESAAGFCAAREAAGRLDLRRPDLQHTGAVPAA
ncbi:MAG: hypothetical protein WAZ15_13535 [Propioniciclava sp.]